MFFSPRFEFDQIVICSAAHVPERLQRAANEFSVRVDLDFVFGCSEQIITTSIDFISHRFDAIISIVAPPIDAGEGRYDQLAKQLMYTHTKQVYPFYFEDRCERGHPEGPTEKHVQEMIRVAKHLIVTGATRILSHCHMGISRSAAFVYILLREAGWRKDHALHEIQRIRTMAKPNRLVRLLFEERRSGSQYDVLRRSLDQAPPSPSLKPLAKF
jgi:hypothetical protein